MFSVCVQCLGYACRLIRDGYFIMAKGQVHGVQAGTSRQGTPPKWSQINSVCTCVYAVDRQRQVCGCGSW